MQPPSRDSRLILKPETDDPVWIEHNRREPFWGPTIVIAAIVTVFLGIVWGIVKVVQAVAGVC